MLDLYITNAYISLQHNSYHNVPYILDWLDLSQTVSLINVFTGSVKYPHPFNRPSLCNWDTSRVVRIKYMFYNSHYNHTFIGPEGEMLDISNVREYEYVCCDHISKFTVF